MSSDLKLDFVSPLPPTRSGIADYSRDLLPRLEPLLPLFSPGLTPVFQSLLEQMNIDIAPYVDYIAAIEARAGGQDIGTIVIRTK